MTALIQGNSGIESGCGEPTNRRYVSCSGTNSAGGPEVYIGDREKNDKSNGMPVNSHTLAERGKAVDNASVIEPKFHDAIYK